MTWPMHDAGPTTPEPGSREPRREPGPAEPGPDEPGSPGYGRRAVADPLPPLEGPMPGGGPSPAETTLPLALGWPAPPARPPRVPRFTPSDPPGSSGSVDAPADWRRVPRPADYHPPDDLRPRPDDLRPRYPQPGYRPLPGAPPGPPGGRGTGRPTARPAAAARTAPHPAGKPGPLRRRHGARHSGLPGHRLPAHPGPGRRDRRRRAWQRVQQREHAAEHRLLPDARRHLYQRGGAAPGPGGQARPGSRRGIRAAHVHPRRGSPPGGHRGGDAAGGPAGRPVCAHHPRPGRQPPGRRARPDGDMGLLLYPADLLLRHELADRGDPEHPRPVRGADVDTGHQQPDRDRRRRALRGDAPGQGAVDHLGRRGAAARDRHHARRGGADRRADPVAAGGRVPVASHAPVPVRRSDRDGPDGRLDVGLRGLPVGRLLVVQIVANAASAGLNGYSAYSIAWQLFQLPYAIIGISVITALLPRMSEHASARRYSLVRDDFSIGVRLASVLVVPASIYLFVLGGPIAEFLIGWFHSTGPYHARYIGEVFGLFSLGLVPYMLTQLQLRVFYSFQDSRTAAFVGLLTMAVSIAADLIVLSLLPRQDVVAGLAIAYGIANLIGATVGWAALLRRVGSLDGWHIARSLTRMHLATVPGLIFAVAVMIGAGHVVTNPSASYGLLVTVVGGGGAVLLYAVCARALRVAEFGFLANTVATRFGGRSRRH